MTAAVLALALGTLTPAPPSVPWRAETFTARDCHRDEGRRVRFQGTVEALDGIGELYRVVLAGNRMSGRQWQALVDRETWGRLEVGQSVTLSGILTLRVVDGDYFATLHVAEH
jgi:hypothetical protein